MLSPLRRLVWLAFLAAHFAAGDGGEMDPQQERSAPSASASTTTASTRRISAEPSVADALQGRLRSHPLSPAAIAEFENLQLQEGFTTTAMDDPAAPRPPRGSHRREMPLGVPLRSTGSMDVEAQRQHRPDWAHDAVVLVRPVPGSNGADDGDVSSMLYAEPLNENERQAALNGDFEQSGPRYERMSFELAQYWRRQRLFVEHVRPRNQLLRQISAVPWMQESLRAFPLPADDPLSSFRHIRVPFHGYYLPADVSSEQFEITRDVPPAQDTSIFFLHHPLPRQAFAPGTAIKLHFCQRFFRGTSNHASSNGFSSFGKATRLNILETEPIHVHIRPVIVSPTRIYQPDYRRPRLVYNETVFPQTAPLIVQLKDNGVFNLPLDSVSKAIQESEQNRAASSFWMRPIHGKRLYLPPIGNHQVEFVHSPLRTSGYRCFESLVVLPEDMETGDYEFVVNAPDEDENGRRVHLGTRGPSYFRVIAPAIDAETSSALPPQSPGMRTTGGTTGVQTEGGARVPTRGGMSRRGSMSHITSHFRGNDPLSFTPVIFPGPSLRGFMTDVPEEFQIVDGDLACEVNEDVPAPPPPMTGVHHGTVGENEEDDTRSRASCPVMSQAMHYANIRDSRGQARRVLTSVNAVGWEGDQLSMYAYADELAPHNDAGHLISESTLLGSPQPDWSKFGWKSETMAADFPISSRIIRLHMRESQSLRTIKNGKVFTIAGDLTMGNIGSYHDYRFLLRISLHEVDADFHIVRDKEHVIFEMMTSLDELITNDAITRRARCAGINSIKLEPLSANNPSSVKLTFDIRWHVELPQNFPAHASLRTFMRVSGNEWSRTSRLSNIAVVKFQNQESKVLPVRLEPFTMPFAEHQPMLYINGNDASLILHFPFSAFPRLNRGEDGPIPCPNRGHRFLLGLRKVELNIELAHSIFENRLQILYANRLVGGYRGEVSVQEYEEELLKADPPLFSGIYVFSLRLETAPLEDAVETYPFYWSLPAPDDEGYSS